MSTKGVIPFKFLPFDVNQMQMNDDNDTGLFIWVVFSYHHVLNVELVQHFRK